MSKKLNFEIGANTDKLDKSLDKATDKIGIFSRKTQASLDKIGGSFQRTGARLSVGLTLPILALGAASVKAASDAEETASKFNTVFKDISNAAQESAEMLRNSYGLARQESQKLLGDTGDLLTGFGFTQSSALDLATEVNKLAVDLASFTNFSGGAAGASAALTKALLGERESVKSLGISILETDVQARVLENTQKGLTFETERQAKAFATLQIAQDQSKNAIGDYERTSGSFANQMRLLQARVKDLSEELGKVLLPFMTKLATKLASLVSGFSEMGAGTKKAIVVIAGLAAAIGPLLIVVGTLLKSLPAIGAALTLLSGPVGLIIAGVVALTIAIYKNWDAVKQWAEDLVNWFIDLYNESILFRAGIEALALQFKNMFAVVKFIMKSLWTIIKAVVSNIVSQFKLLGGVMSAVLTLNPKKLIAAVKAYREAVSDNISTVVKTVEKDFGELTESIVDNVQTAIDNVMTGKKEHVKFEASKESKENLKQDIATAVSGGVVEGLKNGLSGRAATQSISGGLSSQGAQTSAPTPAETGSLSFLAEVSEEAVRLYALMENLALDLNDLVMGSIANTFISLGDAIGQALSGGGNILQNIGKVILESMGRFLQDFGKLMIKYGVAALFFDTVKKSLFTGIGTPAAAAGLIAAGAALSAVGGAIASGANQGISSGGSRGASTAPQSNIRTSTVGGGSGSDVVFRISGRDLVSVIDRNRNHLDRIGG